MEYFFVSDDSYFLFGLETFLSTYLPKVEARASFINTNYNNEIFIPKEGDVVVLYLFNIIDRRKMLNNIKLSLCRVIIMMRIDEKYWTPNILRNPFLVSSKLSLEDFLLVVKKTRGMRFCQNSIKEAEVFFYLGAGYSHSEVARILGLPIKYLYAIRRKLNFQFGLNQLNAATGILLCRDILEMLWHSRGESYVFYEQVDVHRLIGRQSLKRVKNIENTLV